MGEILNENSIEYQAYSIELKKRRKDTNQEPGARIQYSE